MAYLRCVQGSAEQVVELNRERIVIGRLPECDIVVPQREASRLHAAVLREGDGYYVEDLSSRNGTFVNGERVEGRRLLRDGDEISIGKVVTLVFRTGSPTDHHGPSVSGEVEPQILVALDWGTSTLLQARPETKLAALLEILGTLGTSLDLQEVMSHVLESLARIFPQMDQGLVLLYDAARSTFDAIAGYSRRRAREPRKSYSETLARHVVEKKQAILSADVARDAEFDMSQSIAELQIRSMMSVPLFGSNGDVLGIIELHTHNPRRRFVRQDLEILTAVACAASVAVENAQLHSVLVAKERLERELELAKEVQRNMLPALPPSVGCLELCSHYEPARVVGGDFFDFVRLPSGEILIALGDVAGKGMPAALLMARVITELRTLAPTAESPANLLKWLNDSLCERALADRFVTMAVAVFAPDTGRVRFSVAAHPPPAIRRGSAEVEFVGTEARGLPLGVTLTASYPLVEENLNEGDIMLLYTDGVTDACSRDGTLFGLDGVRRALAGATGRGPVEVAESLITAVRRHAGDVPRFDDQCFVCVGRRSTERTQS